MRSSWRRATWRRWSATCHATRSCTQKVEDGSDLLKTIEPTLSPSHATWLVVDYRWPGFRELAKETRLKEERVPKGYPEMMKLFRVY
jgi:hypothetical protein